MFSLFYYFTINTPGIRFFVSGRCISRFS